MLKKTGFYAAVAKAADVRIITNLPDIPFPVAAIERRNVCCLAISKDDSGKLYIRLEVATRSLSAFPSELVIVDVYRVSQNKNHITMDDTIHDCIGGAVIPKCVDDPVEIVTEFSDLF